VFGNDVWRRAGASHPRALACCRARYSRAFGGKDLKPFGLSASPSVRQVRLDAARHAGLVLCSDGVCDVFDADACALLVAGAWARGEDAAAGLVRAAIDRRAQCGVGADNVTAVVLRFDAALPPA
jgi:serine/threonine protein phosphatase PrpC